MSHSRWNVMPSFPSGKDTPYTPLLTQLLYNRGLTDPSKMDAFLAADASLSGDPYLLPDMHQAAARLYQGLLSNERIAVYGDFDADGISATALLVEGLAMLDCKATPYIPHRLTEGYGLKTIALENLKKQGVSLVVTVDCGVTALEEVRKARKMGLDIIVTDHHIPSEELPAARAVVNPKLTGSRYPFTELAGVGVALKLLQALFRGMGKEHLLNELSDLVAIGTVADMAPLLGENRYLVKQGLELLSKSPRLGIREMMAQSGSQTDCLDAESISWVIAPRLNAAGRLEHAMGSYKLLTTDSQDEARDLAKWLEEKNTERQRLTAKVLEKAREQVQTQLDAPILFASDPEFPAGIIGLVAGRLSDEFYRPVIILRTNEHLSGGSCRSIPEFHITNALARCRHLLTHFGGHAGAAGLGLKTPDLPRLKKELTEIAAAELAGTDLRPRIDIDAEVPLSMMNGESYTAIQKLAPFGEGNPAPTFISRRVNVLECRTMGIAGDHLRLKLKQGDSFREAVGFGLGSRRPEIKSVIDIVYRLELDKWNGQEKLRLNLLDFGPSM